MPRFAKKGSTKTNILEQMFKELKKDPESFENEINGVEIKNIPNFNAINSNDYDELIELYLYYMAYTETSQANKDVQKIDFDFENTEPDKDGTEKLPDGTEIIWAWAGGDWENPVRFVLYLDPNNKIRAYIPSKGNTYCHKCKCAFGTCTCNDDDGFDEVEPNYDLMYADVCNRIQTK